MRVFRSSSAGLVNRRRHHGVLKWIAVVTVVLGIVAPVPALASTSHAHHHKNKKKAALAKGRKFYRGKQVSFILPSAAGSPYDTMYRMLTLYMGKYLGAAINVIDDPIGHGVAGQDQLAASTPDGLTIGQLNLGTDYYDQLQNQPYLNFNPAREDIFGVPSGFGTQIIYTQADSPYQTIPDLRNAKSPIKVCMYGSLTATDTTLFLKDFGIKGYSYVFGYTSGSAEAAGFLRGDCQIIATSIGQFKSELLAHKVTALAILSPGTTTKPYAPAGVSFTKPYPTDAQLEHKYPPTTPLEKKAASLLATVVRIPNNALSAPARTPSYKLAALVAAMKHALKQPEVSSLFHSYAVAAKYQSGKKTRQMFATGLKKLKALRSITHL